MKHIKAEDLKPGMDIWYAAQPSKVLQVEIGEELMAIMYERHGRRFISDNLGKGAVILQLSPQDLRELTKGDPST